jgi:hypothetical protein
MCERSSVCACAGGWVRVRVYRLGQALFGGAALRHRLLCRRCCFCSLRGHVFCLGLGGRQRCRPRHRVFLQGRHLSQGARRSQQRKGERETEREKAPRNGDRQELMARNAGPRMAGKTKTLCVFVCVRACTRTVALRVVRSSSQARAAAAWSEAWLARVARTRSSSARAAAVSAAQRSSTSSAAAC